MDTNQLEGLPLELLEKIIEQLPALDILRVGQANRGFHDLIHRSPQIQHKLDLSAAGLEPNWSTDFTLADRVKALEKYRSRWDNIDIDKYGIPTGPRPVGSKTTVGGVYSIHTNDEIKFFSLSSSLRSIGPKIHKVPVDPGAVGFAFNPHADVIVVAVPIGSILELRLMTMSEGVPHPSALKKTIESNKGTTGVGVSLSISSHRLASMVEHYEANTFPLSIWDWRTGELLFEHCSPNYQYFEFLDDYRLASVEVYDHDASQGLLVFDTERVSHVAPTQTRFHSAASSRRWIPFFEASEYNPSPRDILSAPFYPDPSQRILALSMGPQWGFHVIKVERLLRFARERAGEEIQWEEWKQYLIETVSQGIPDGIYYLGSWVSGFRFISAFIAWGDGGCTLRVYDFSPRGSMKFLHSGGDGCRVMDPSVAAFRLPRYNTGIRGISFGHDSIVVELYPAASEDVPNITPDIGNF